MTDVRGDVTTATMAGKGRRLQMRLFGQFRLQLGEAQLPPPKAAKVRELLSYLLVFRDRRHCREILASLLWPDVPTAQAKKYLRQALWQLQAALHSPGATASSAIQTEGESVGLRSDVWLDVAVFERAAVLAAAPAPFDDRTAREVEAAVELYAGDLLEGWYQEWVQPERERLQGQYLQMLDKLMDFCEARAEYDRALAYGAVALRYDRARECTHQRLMRVCLRRGDRAGALRQYERCATALRTELDAEPGAATLALLRQIRDGDVEGVAMPTLPVRTPTENGATVPELMAEVRALRDLLIAMRERLDETQAMVEQLGPPLRRVGSSGLGRARTQRQTR